MSSIQLNDMNFACQYRLLPTNNFNLTAKTEEKWGGGVAELGWTAYSPREFIAVILLKRVDNLGWLSSLDNIVNWDCPAGTVFIASKRADFSINWPEPGDILIVHFDEQVLNRHDFYRSLTEHADTSADLVSFVSKQCLQLGQLIWNEFLEGVSADDVYLAALYQVLIHRLGRGGDDLRAPSTTDEGLSTQASRQIEAYLKESFREQISVQDMAALLGISSGHFTTCFKASFGLTPHQYVIKLRLDEAELCLRNTDMPIGEVAARLGFSSQSHLTTAFRKYRGLTPKEIRRRGSARRNPSA